MDAADSEAESELAANTRPAREKEIPAMQPLAVGTFEFYLLGLPIPKLIHLLVKLINWK